MRLIYRQIVGFILTMVLYLKLFHTWLIITCNMRTVCPVLSKFLYHHLKIVIWWNVLQFHLLHLNKTHHLFHLWFYQIDPQDLLLERYTFFLFFLIKMGQPNHWEERKWLLNNSYCTFLIFQIIAFYCIFCTLQFSSTNK